MKKILIITAVFLFIWILMTGALYWVYSTTRYFENLIQEKIIAAIPEESEMHLGKIQGNIFSGIIIDSSRIKFENSFEIRISKIKTNYSLFSFLSGSPRIHSLDIFNPVIHLIHTDKKKDTVSVKNVNFNLNDAEIPFEKIFPDSIHQVIKNAIIKIPNIELNRLSIHNLTIINDTEELLSNSNIEIEIYPGLIRVKKTDGLLINKIPLIDFSFSCSYDTSTVIVNQLNLKTDESLLKGKVDIDLEEKINGLWVIDSIKTNERELSRLFHNSRDLFQQVNLNSSGYVYFYPESIYFDISPSGFFNEFRIDSSEVKGKIGKTSLLLRKLKIWSPDGFIEGDMLTGFRLKTWLNLFIRDLNLDKFLPGIDSSKVNLDFKMNFDKWDVNSLNGRLKFNLYDSYVNQIKLKNILLNIDAQDGQYFIDSTSGAYFDENAVFNLSGNFNGKLGGEVTLSFDEVDFFKLGGAVGLDGLKGSGYGYFKLSGDLLNPDLSSDLLLDSLGFNESVGYGIEEQIFIRKLFTERLGHYKLDISSAITGPMEVTDTYVDLNIDKNDIFIDSLQFYNYDNLLNISGHVRIDTSTIFTSLDRFEITYQKIRLFNPDSLILVYNFDKNGLDFEQVYFETSQGGEIDARGTLNFTDTTSAFALYMKDINLKLINQFDIIPYQLSGAVNIEGILEESIYSPVVLFEGNLDSIIVDTLNLGSINLNGKFARETAYISELHWQDDASFLDLTAKVNIDSFFNQNEMTGSDFIRINLSDFELNNIKNLFGFNYPLTGEINSSLLIKNSLANLAAEGEITLNNFKFQDYAVDSIYTYLSYYNNELKLNDGTMKLNSTEFLFYLQTFVKYSIENKTFSFVDEPLKAFLSSRTNSLDFIGSMNEEVQNVRGDININIELGGTVGEPLLQSGSITITDGDLYLYKLANKIKITKFEADFENGILTINMPEAYAVKEKEQKSFMNRFWENISGVFNFWKKQKNDGLLVVKGKIDLRDIARPDMDLQVKMTKGYINYFIENVELVATTKNLKISGQDTLLISGDIQIDQGQYILDLDKYEKNLMLVTSAREKPPYQSLNLDINIPGNFYLIQKDPLNSFDFQLMGDVRILKEPHGIIEVSGITEIIEGKLFLYGKELRVVTGKFSFVNPKELPDLDIVAGLQQGAFYFEIIERGKISSPSLEIKIYDSQTDEELQYDIKDKLAILLTGMPFEEMNSAGLKDQGKQVLTASIMSLVENKAKEYTGLDKIQIGKEGIDQPNASGNLNDGIQDVSYFTMGKYLSHNVYLEYKTGMAGENGAGIGAPKISWEPGNEIQLNYRLNRNWSLGTNYSLTREGNRKIKFDVAWKFHF